MTRVITNEGTFDVQYQDGTFDKGLPRQCLQASATYAIGDEVAVRHDEWYRGSISAIYTSESGELVYDVECEEFVVQGALVEDFRRIEPGLIYEEGELVEAQFEDEGWFRGIIDRVNSDGTYVVLYDDGDVSNNLADFMIRKVQ